MNIFAPGLRYARTWFAAGLLLAALVTFFSLLPAKQLPPVGINDKYEHIISYTILAFWFGSVIARRDFLYLGLALIALGGAIEILQGLMGMGRESDLRDFWADCLGVAIGLVLAWTPIGHWASLIDHRVAARRRR
jgi:VanZ family protein